MDLQEITKKIMAVCPIEGISVGSDEDKTTWRIDFREEATAEERAAALAIVETYDSKVVSLADMKVTAIYRIDQAAGAARGRYITISPCQSATYFLKADDAKAYRDAGYPDQNINIYPFVKAKAFSSVDNPTADDYRAAADLILQRRVEWVAIGAAIEQVREKGKSDVLSAETSESVILVQDKTLGALAAI